MFEIPSFNPFKKGTLEQVKKLCSNYKNIKLEIDEYSDNNKIYIWISKGSICYMDIFYLNILKNIEPIKNFIEKYC